MSHPALGFFVRQYKLAGSSQELKDRYLKMILDNYVLKKLEGVLEAH